MRFCPRVAVTGRDAIDIAKSAPALTVTVNEQDDLFPHASVAFQVTVVIPGLKEAPFKVARAVPVVAPVSVAVRVKLLQASVAEAFHEASGSI